MTISVKGERYNVLKNGDVIGDMTIEDDALSIVIEEALSVEDLKDLLKVVERVEKENDL